ncbi:MAG: hypothetical protein FK734_13400 [Asgard group archaeon]|nr:hypothetical protein [Asgard group archaeon]
MAKGRVLLGAFLGGLIGTALVILTVFLTSTYSTIGWLPFPLVFVSWLLGGFFAGIIAGGPGRGAGAGALTAIFNFIISAIGMVLIVVVAGVGITSVIFEILTLGLFDPTTIPPELIAMLIGIALLVAFILSLISAVLNAITGLIGGAIRNPNRKKKDAYQDYPADNLR